MKFQTYPIRGHNVNIFLKFLCFSHSMTILVNCERIFFFSFDIFQKLSKSRQPFTNRSLGIFSLISMFSASRDHVKQLWAKNYFFIFLKFSKKLSPDPLCQGVIESFFCVCFFAFGNHSKPFWATTKKSIFWNCQKNSKSRPLYQGVIGSIFFLRFFFFLHSGTVLSHFEQQQQKKSIFGNF